jgi:hypothetical protein
MVRNRQFPDTSWQLRNSLLPNCRGGRTAHSYAFLPRAVWMIGIPPALLIHAA